MTNLSHLDVIIIHFKCIPVQYKIYLKGTVFHISNNRILYKLQCFCDLNAEVKRLPLQYEKPRQQSPGRKC